MKRRGQVTTLQERLTIAERAKQGAPDAAIADDLGCSRWTVRKWRRIGQRDERSTMQPVGRPPVGPLGSSPPALVDTVRELRRQRPGWGPLTILVALHVDPRWPDTVVPSRARVAAFLKAEGYTRRYQRRSQLPSPQRLEVIEPHDEWQLDAQGVTVVAGIGKVMLINAVDVISRLKVESYPSANTTNPPAEDYFLALRRAFLVYGLPARIALDHGTVFFDNTTTSPFPTRLHLWLVALGIDVAFIRPRRPTDQAIVERTHQTMSKQALEGQTWETGEALWAGLDARRDDLNHPIPTPVLGQQAPLQVFPAAVHSGRSYRPEWEATLLDVGRVDRYLARGRWFRQVRSNGYIQLGGYGYYLGKRLVGAAVVVTFDPDSRHLLCKPEGKAVAVAVAIQGMTAAELMGELAGIVRLPTYQLALPLFPPAYGASMARLYADAAGKTSVESRRRKSDP
jgi:transposase InsO family protein